MELTRGKIRENKALIPGLVGYYTVISEIEDNLSKNPDISIESCKSLIEGLCKKALESVSDKYNSDKQLRGACEDKMPTLIKTAFDEVYSSSIERDLHESLYKIIKSKVRTQKLLESAKEKLLMESKIAVAKITAIRHTRGDISHGRIYPKIKESEIHLANSIKAITDGICSYMIHEFALQYKIKTELYGRLIYSDLLEYNEWLDEQNDKLITKIDFSGLLYTNNYEKYEEIYYTDYYEEVKDIDIEETIESIPEEKLEKVDEVVLPEKAEEEEKVIIEFKKEKIKTLVNDFYEDTFWTDEKNEVLHKFVEEQNLIFDETKKVIEEYLFTEKRPLPDEVVNTLINKPNLKERKEVVIDLSKIIVEFSKSLKE